MPDCAGRLASANVNKIRVWVGTGHNAQDQHLYVDAFGIGTDISECATAGSAHIHALQDLAEDAVLAVQPRREHRGDEKLAAVGVGPGVGHAQQARLLVLQLEVLVRERPAMGCVRILKQLLQQHWATAVLAKP